MNSFLKSALVSLTLFAGIAATPGAAKAQDCFIGEIRMFGGNFAPRNWALTDGQLLPIAQNSALFSILGATYGGDGRQTFALPDLRGRVAMHAGSGGGLTGRRLGQKLGAESATLTVQQMPAHSHGLTASSSDGDKTAPGGNYLADGGNDRLYHAGPGDVTLNAGAVASAGGGRPVGTVSPAQVVNHIICLQGYFPSRS